MPGKHKTGELFKFLRLINGYSQSDLSVILNVSKSYISEMENGYKPTHPDILIKYARLMGINEMDIVKLFVLQNKEIEVLVDKIKIRCKNSIIEIFKTI